MPFYAVIAVAFGNVDALLQTPIPIWNPLDWNVGWMQQVLGRPRPRRRLLGRRGAHARVRRLSLFFSLLIGYPVAYYIARHAGRTKNLLLILLIMPFWISYLMRMLAWVNLLAADGYATRFLDFTHLSNLAVSLGLLSQHDAWLNGQSFTVIAALVYGYIPYFILPLYASLDRIDKSLLEAGRDLGGSPFRPSCTSPCRCPRPAFWAALC